jgi:hypothetical protein
MSICVVNKKSECLRSGNLRAYSNFSEIMKRVATKTPIQDEIAPSDNLLQCMVRLYKHLEVMSRDEAVDKHDLYITASDGVSDLMRHTIAAPYETSFSFKIDADQTI